MGASGLLFLRLYAGLAAKTVIQRCSRFPLTPKCHFLHHCFVDLFRARDQWTTSPLAFSVRMDEDFVGKIARYPRRSAAESR